MSANSVAVGVPEIFAEVDTMGLLSAAHNFLQNSIEKYFFR